MKSFASNDLTENGAAKKRQTNVAKNKWLEFWSGPVTSVVSIVTASAQ